MQGWRAEGYTITRIAEPVVLDGAMIDRMVSIIASSVSLVPLFEFGPFRV
ncbi:MULTISPECIES: hypothetical protein [Paenibacillus]|nr:hypothetical protein [Paenibacillus caseinilyticus]MCZ8521566.1 hypothetical protein [Paenibacillus caseinilyticus]